MQYICIMGNDEQYINNINDKLIKMGYYDNTIWSTRKTQYTEVLSEDSYDKNVELNKLIHLETKNGVKYGILRPVGHSKYISHVSVQQFDKIKEIYKEQVTGLYINYKDPVELKPDEASILQKHKCAILVCNNISDMNSIVAEILRFTRI